MLMVGHPEICRRLKRRYRQEDIRELLDFLEHHRTLRFAALPTGLYPAAGIDAQAAAASGYGNVWVRDNVYVAFALERAGRSDAAAAAVEALATFYRKYRARFTAIIDGHADPVDPMSRPAIRFDGVKLAELATVWPHAQNDALGYFLWLYCRLSRRGRVTPDHELLRLFAHYFAAIRYWQDEDSGHWEERRKTEASSIGAVVAGLRELRRFSPDFGGDALDRLIAHGETALGAILPAECNQPDPRKYRRYDAALLFLCRPLAVVDEAMTRRIVDDVLNNLQGDYGIRRYLGDSYWTADYKDKKPAAQRTADVSEAQDKRDALAGPGEEAQWCIFDPIVSVIFGRCYLSGGEQADLERQVHHLNRALGQLTGPGCPQGELRCPEAYYLEHGRYVPNDHVPLLWTQANLWLALIAMEQSAARADRC